jgi:hypothetical protein
MKKILFILAVLMTANLFAQTPIKIWDAYSKVWKVVGDTATSEYTPLPVSVTGSVGTIGGNLEETQLLIKKVLQAARPSGKSYYSSLEGDFTATAVSGTKKVAITGLSFTLDQKDVVSASYRKLAGDWYYLGFEPSLGTGDTLSFTSMTGTFLSTDQVDIVIVNVPKTEDKANDANKSLEQSPLWARYQIDEIYDGTNLGAGTNYYPSATGAPMDGYTNLSFTSNLVDADGTITYSLEVTNDEDLTNGTWMPVYGYDATLNAVVNTLTVTNGTLNSAWDFDNLNVNGWRVKVVTSGSTNTVVIKSRRTFR